MAPLRTHRLQTTRTSRLVEVGTLGPDTRLILLACHGYGMDVERFAARFADVLDEVCVLCPEGLSRFYWGGFDGNPVASWMTRAEREHEIADLSAWLDRVWVFAKAAAPEAAFVGFGFSQGAATLMRWADQARPALAAVVLWSGTPPEDIAYEPRTYWDAVRRVAYWGDNDELVPYARAAARFAEVPIAFERRHFRGGHDLPRKPLLGLVTELLSPTQAPPGTGSATA